MKVSAKDVGIRKWSLRSLTRGMQAAVLFLVVCGGQIVADDLPSPTPARSIQSSEPCFTPVLSAAPITLDRNASAETLDRQIASRCQTGSLVFSRGDCLAVKLTTGSRYTHVAVIVFVDDAPWVYDSMNGTGVRKLPLKSYLEIQSPDELTLYHPCRPFTADEQTEFRFALDQQIGKKYSVWHFVTGRRAKGVHCAEYVTDSLMTIDWLKAKNPVRVSPASLLTGVSQSGVYQGGEVICIPRELEPIPETDNWREALWQNTCLMASGSCRQMSRWVLCH